MLLTPLLHTDAETNKINPSGDKVRDIKQTDGCCGSQIVTQAPGTKTLVSCRKLSLIFTEWTGDKEGDDFCNSA